MSEIKKEKKNNKILVIILIVALLTMSFYIVYDKVLSNETTNKTSKETNEKTEVKEDEETKEEEKTPQVEVLEVTSEEVENLLNKIGALYACEKNRYYLDKKVVANDIDNDEAYSRAIRLIHSETLKAGTTTSTTLTEEQVENVVARIYGKDYKFTHKKRSSCPIYTYDGETKSYTLSTDGCGYGTCGPNTDIREVVKAMKIDDKVEIYVRILFVGKESSSANPNTMNYYKDYNLTQPLSELQVDAEGFVTNSDENLKKGSLYKFIFTKENNDYSFTSSELAD